MGIFACTLSRGYLAERKFYLAEHQCLAFAVDCDWRVFKLAVDKKRIDEFCSVFLGQPANLIQAYCVKLRIYGKLEEMSGVFAG